MTVPCIPTTDDESTVDLTANADQAVVCWAGGCIAPDMTSQDATSVARPAATHAWLDASRAEVRTTDGKLTACLGPTCAPIGPKLAAAITVAAANADRPITAEVTTDLRAVTLGDTAWSVKADKALSFKAPASYKRGAADKPSLTAVQAAGPLLVTTWYDCAGPCAVGQLTDSSGKHLGKSFAGGGPMLQVDDDFFVVASEYDDLALFTTKGKLVTTAEGLGDPSSLARLARLDSGQIGLLSSVTTDALRLTIMMTGPTRIHRVGERILPRCPATPAR